MQSWGGFVIFKIVNKEKPLLYCIKISFMFCTIVTLRLIPAADIAFILGGKAPKH